MRTLLGLSVTLCSFWSGCYGSPVKPETGRWLKHAEDDLAIADMALNRGLYSQCVFHCQQALEKLLKAHWIEHLEEPHPRTHNLAALALRLDIGATDQQLAFLQRLAEQYLPSHYADFDVEYPEEAGRYYYRLTEETYAWLRQQLS